MLVLTSCQATFHNVEEYTEIVVGTQTKTTGAWTGRADLKELRDGQQITYWLPYNGSGNATLDLTLADGTTTGAVPCYYSGTSRLTTHYAAGNAIHLTYRENVSINGSSTKYTGWWADANYTTGDNNVLRSGTNITAKTGITAGRLIVADDSGYFHLAANVPFHTDKPIMYCASGIAAGAKNSWSNYLSHHSVAIRNNLSGFTGIEKKSCYIVGILSGTVFTPNAALFTCTEPASEDGLVYILLGYMVTATQLSLYPEHPMYRYAGGGFKSFAQIAYEAREAAENAQKEIEETNITVQTHTEKLSTHDAKITANETAINLRVTTSNFESYKTTVNGELSSAKSRLSASETSIQALQGRIALKVEQTDIDTAVQGIEIGGRNLLWNSDFSDSATKITTSANKYGLYTRGSTYTATVDTTTKYNSHNSLKIVGKAGGNESGQDVLWWINGIKKNAVQYFTAGEQYVVSFYAKAESACTFRIRYAYGGYGDYGTFNITTEWKRYVAVLPKTTTAYCNQLIFYVTTAATIYLADVKVEKGTKATGWTPAPEDIDASITAVDAKFSSYSTTTQMKAEITAAKNSITQSVSETYATKSALETANGNITSLTSRVSSAESKLTKDSLVTTIGSYYATTDNLNYANTFIIGTQTAVTGSWTGKAAFASLRDGQQITYWLPYNGSGNATLNLTLSGGEATGAVPCYYSGTSRLTTHYAAGNSIRLTYRENVTIGSTTIAKGWWADANYDSNTMDRLRYQSVIKAKAAVTAGRLIVSDDGGYFHVAAGTAFDTRKAILWAGSNLAAGAAGTNNYTMYSYVNVAASKSGWTGTQYASVYLVGTLSGVNFIPNDTMFTTTVPAAEDGLTYILLGQMYSATNMVLFAEHPMYRYMNGDFQKVEQGALTMASQTVEKFQWIVKSGTSATDFTLTDRTAALVAETISLNGNVKVNGSMLVDGAVTANKLAANSVTAAKIATDAIKSRNYAYTSGNFSTAGTFLDLSTGLIRSKNFAIDSAGNAYFKGSLSGATGSFSGDVTATNAVIKDKISMYATTAWGSETKYDVITAATETNSKTPFLEIGASILAVKFVSPVYAESLIKANAGISGNVITSANSIYTNGKASAVDGVRGVCVGADASVSLTGDATYVPRINFMCAGATATQAQIRSSAANKLEVNASAGISLNASSGAANVTSASCAIKTTGAITLDNGKFIFGMFNSETNFRVANDYDNKVNLGTSGARWMKVYAASGTIGTSDERDKDILGDVDDRYKRLYMALEPIVYRWRDSSIDQKTHIGLGAQRTERSALACGIASAEIGMIEHDFWSEPSRDGRTDRYGMNYQEVAVLTVPIVQEHERRLKAHDDRIASIQNREEALQCQLTQALTRIAQQDARIAAQVAEIAKLRQQIYEAA